MCNVRALESEDCLTFVICEIAQDCTCKFATCITLMTECVTQEGERVLQLELGIVQNSGQKLKNVTQQHKRERGRDPAAIRTQIIPVCFFQSVAKNVRWQEA